MKKIILALGLIYLILWTKTELTLAVPTISVTQEDPIKYKTNLDKGAYNVTYTLPVFINISSKIQSACFL